MEKEVIQVEIPAGKKAAWVDGFLKLVDTEEEQKKDERPITERVKTFEDACKELGEDHKLVQQFKAIQEAIAEDKEATAYFKLGIITAALNEGWEPEFTNYDEYRYYPYLCLWTKEELEDKDEAWKDDHNLQLCICVGSSSHGANCGLAFAASDAAWSIAAAGLSARLDYHGDLKEVTSAELKRLLAS